MPSAALPDVPCRARPRAAGTGTRTDWTPWQREVLLPLLLVALATLVLQGLGGDRWITDRLFAAEGGRWALRDAANLTTSRRSLHSS